MYQCANENLGASFLSGKYSLGVFCENLGVLYNYKGVDMMDRIVISNSTKTKT